MQGQEDKSAPLSLWEGKVLRSKKGVRCEPGGRDEQGPRLGNHLLFTPGLQEGALGQWQPPSAPEHPPAQRELGTHCCQCHSPPNVRVSWSLIVHLDAGLI